MDIRGHFHSKKIAIAFSARKESVLAALSMTKKTHVTENYCSASRGIAKMS
jgi:hypothetical protein